MMHGRMLIMTVTLISLFTVYSRAEAGWWFGGESQADKSGLDLDQGFDRNTVVTKRGRVISTDQEGNSGPALAVIQTATDQLTLVLGPKTYWNENGFPIPVGSEIFVKGSQAVGRDGATYLIVQSIGNSANGTEVILRNESGHPAWSGTGRNNADRQRQRTMRQHRGGRRNR